MKKSQLLSKQHYEMVKHYYYHLKGKRYSDQTIKLYGGMVTEFLLFYNSDDMLAVNNEAIHAFNERVIIKKNLSVSYQRQFVSAMKLFCKLYLLDNVTEEGLRRPKKRRKLPVVLSPEEVIAVLRYTANLKHRTALALIYSSGLRINELLNLKVADVDLIRKQVRIVQSKGWKDRYVVLSEKFLILFHNYLQTYEPKDYLFEGQEGGKYSAKSLSNVLKRSSTKAGIKKHITLHTLRHSYATHLLENGIDIRYIQTLLGHSRPETTMIYTHVRRKDLSRIKSPLDLILENQNNPSNIPLPRPDIE